MTQHVKERYALTLSCITAGGADPYGRASSDVVAMSQPGLYRCNAGGHPTCGKPMDGSRLQSHLLSVHGANGATVYTCGECGWRLNGLGALINHKPVHVLTTACQTCGLQFASAGQRFDHLRQHHGLSPGRS
ncbi:uncharacterized protein BXZ73DRAFT_101556 [Epithele typhae]|uniref:uncharacterized protein n=1 Tax=Epithele typhae TaxID=378194 RepID=UPI0020088FC3|nr:uncharacterized protein BXZ73DRAFT_101556 [Epithele typhae]KAH9931645.1 hypothetical protein BXZ73DRAFT_101556 [Epithele typhae]